MNLMATLAALELTDSTKLGLVGLALFAIALYSLTLRRRRRVASVDGRASEQSQSHNIRRDMQARDDINELMVRLEELSREICGQIDTRYAKLDYLLTRAERTMEALKHAAAAPPASAAAEAPPADPRHAEIHSLSQQGLPNIDIARRMNLSVGEVELVLSLERSRRQTLPDADAAAPGGATRKARPPKKSAGLDARA